MTIQWYGHSCFRLESKGLSILIDPFSKEIGLRPPKIKDDVILVSHNHYDHADTSDASPETIIIKNPGEYEVKGAYIEGIQSFHDNSGGSERGLNIIFIIRFDGMKVCHMGDFGQNDLEGHQLEKIGNVDILLLPVGGTYTIDGKQAVRLVRKIEPKIVIPMHYSVPDLKQRNRAYARKSREVI